MAFVVCFGSSARLSRLRLAPLCCAFVSKPRSGVTNGESDITSHEGSNVDKVTHTGQVWDKDDYRRVRFINKDKLINERFAIDYIENDPVIVVKGQTVISSGGGGALGHPKVFINLDRDEVAVCGYSGRKFIRAKFYKPEEHGPSITYEEFLKEQAL